ncbi:MAG: methyltransferase domain-containing protein [Acetobacteraceae bacterium]|nr:methyltransferase domain-containing protein [Acetobacteraceae bacterium]
MFQARDILDTNKRDKMSLDRAHYEEKSLDYFSGSRPEIEAVLPEQCSKVLEIGCGAGQVMARIKQTRKIVRSVGIDLMPAAIEQAKLIFDEATAANVETSDLPNEQFDLIIALDVLEHLSDPWRMIQRLHALLVPGGTIVVSLPHVGHWTVSWPLLTKGQWDYTSEGLLDRTHLRFFSRRGAEDLMTSSGLVIEKLQPDRVYPAWMRRFSPSFRWYAGRIFEMIFPSHLLVYRFLIRAGHIAPRQA